MNKRPNSSSFAVTGLLNDNVNRPTRSISALIILRGSGKFAKSPNSGSTNVSIFKGNLGTKTKEITCDSEVDSDVSSLVEVSSSVDY